MQKTTIEEKTKRGTLRPDRVRKMSFPPLREVPNPTFELSPVELKYFRDCCASMIEDGTLAEAFLPAITRASRMYGIYEESCRDVEKYGMVQKTSTGYTQKSGYFTVMTDAFQILLNFEKSMGLNLVTKSRLPDMRKPEEPNPFDTI